MNVYHKLFEIFQKHYLMYAMIGVLASSSLGAAAAMAALHKGHGFLEMFQVGLLVAVAMWFNATILADRKRKTVYNAFILSIAVSFLILLIHLI